MESITNQAIYYISKTPVPVEVRSNPLYDIMIPFISIILGGVITLLINHFASNRAEIRKLKLTTFESLLEVLASARISLSIMKDSDSSNLNYETLESISLRLQRFDYLDYTFINASLSSCRKIIDELNELITNFKDITVWEFDISVENLEHDIKILYDTCIKERNQILGVKSKYQTK